MHSVKKIQLYLSFITAIFLVVFIHPVLSQPPTGGSPYVESSESFYAYVGDVALAISNDAQNIFTCLSYGDCSIWRRDVNEEIPILGSNGIAAYWSIDNSRLVTMDKDYNCTPNTELYNVILFETETGSVSRHCASESARLENWSPLQPHEYYSLSIVNTNTFQTTSFSRPTSLSLADISHYWGYGRAFWDLNTALPVGKIFLRVERNLQSQLTSSGFQICTFNGKDCQTILDTLAVAPVDVFDYKLYKSWILWGGHLSANGQATNIKNKPSEIADTVLYLTDFHTGVTYDLFRFSSLGQSDTYVHKLAWAPDGKTIGLAIKQLDNSSLLPTLPPEGTSLPTPTYPPGIVLLHIALPPVANVDKD
jgi:hypothetical protein